MEIIINNIAIWSATLHQGFSVKQHPMGTIYLTKEGLAKRANRTMYRYAKTYTVGKTDFVLFVRTFNDDMVAIEKELDKVAKTITEDYARKQTFLSPEQFEYLNQYVKGDEE